MDPRVQHWLDRDPDPQTRHELEALVQAGDTAAIEARFGGRLAFGTAGLRGIMGAGPKRMNRLVVRETTAGLGQYLLDHADDAKARGVVVGFDGRHGSHDFAADTAAVLAALGIRVHLFDRDVPTPVCAFAVSHLNAAAGVVVTASHNPPEYNGYKVYWGNGAQIIPPHDSGIAAAIDVAAQRDIPWLEPAEGRSRGLIDSIGDAVLATYLQRVGQLSVHAERTGRDALVIAYTPLHGVGARVTEAALAQAGFTQVHTVAEQREPDGDFPTVRFPNPEEPGAMDRVLALARSTSAAIAIANDPDADRFAAAVRQADGNYRMLTGNEIGILLAADQLAANPARAVVATTIVSSRMLQALARARGASYFETLTGFKWIANGALACEAAGDQFVLGYEEALGYTVGDLVRDKDGISAAAAFAEMAAALADKHQTVLERLEELSRELGLYITAQKSLALSPDAPGPSVGDRLRRQRPQRVAGHDVLALTDLQTGERRAADGSVERVDLPASDVLVFELAGDARVIVRPSGTEPKLKCYYELRSEVGADESFGAAEARARAELQALIDRHQAELG